MAISVCVIKRIIGSSWKMATRSHIASTVRLVGAREAHKIHRTRPAVVAHAIIRVEHIVDHARVVVLEENKVAIAMFFRPRTPILNGRRARRRLGWQRTRRRRRRRRWRWRGWRRERRGRRRGRLGQCPCDFDGVDEIVLLAQIPREPRMRRVDGAHGRFVIIVRRVGCIVGGLVIVG